MGYGGNWYISQSQGYELEVCQGVQPDKLSCDGLDGSVCDKTAAGDAAVIMYHLACGRRGMLYNRYSILSYRKKALCHALRMACMGASWLCIPVYQSGYDPVILKGNTGADDFDGYDNTVRPAGIILLNCLIPVRVKSVKAYLYRKAKSPDRH